MAKEITIKEGDFKLTEGEITDLNRLKYLYKRLKTLGQGLNNEEYKDYEQLLEMAEDIFGS